MHAHLWDCFVGTGRAATLNWLNYNETGSCCVFLCTNKFKNFPVHAYLPLIIRAAFFSACFGSTAKKPSLKLFQGAFRGKIAPGTSSSFSFTFFFPFNFTFRFAILSCFNPAENPLRFPPYLFTFASPQIIGSFSNDDGDGNQDVKKAIGLLRKTTTSHVHHAFLYISLRPSTTTTWKCLNASFMEDVNKRRRILFSLSKLECGPQEINSRESRLHLPCSANWNKRDEDWKNGNSF